MKLIPILKEMNIKEEIDTKSQASKLLQPYITLLSEFKPSKIRMELGEGVDMFYFEINVPGQFENPSIYVDIKNGEELHSRHDTPIGIPFINVWFKSKTNNPQYKQGIQKVMSLLASKNPNMKVSLEDYGIDGTVKQWSNIKKIENQY